MHEDEIMNDRNLLFLFFLISDNFLIPHRNEAGDTNSVQMLFEFHFPTVGNTEGVPSLLCFLTYLRDLKNSYVSHYI
jgi:hypothetical protein